MVKRPNTKPNIFKLPNNNNNFPIIHNTNRRTKTNKLREIQLLHGNNRTSTIRKENARLNEGNTMEINISEELNERLLKEGKELQEKIGMEFNIEQTIWELLKIANQK